MNKETRTLMLELKNNTIFSHTSRPIHRWIDIFHVNKINKRYANDPIEYTFYTACKLMVACGFGDEII